MGGNPFQTSSIYTLIHFLEREWGVYFPKGGTHALVRTLVKLFEELGGELRLSTPVESADVSTDGANTQHTITTATAERKPSTWSCPMRMFIIP